MSFRIDPPLQFNDNAKIAVSDLGDLVLTTGTDLAPAAEFTLGRDGKILINGVEFTGGGSAPTEPTEPTEPPATTVPDWTRPALLSAWKQRSWSVSTQTEVPGFRKVGHRVELTGDLDGADVAASSIQPGESCIIFRLPVGSRPLTHAKTLLTVAGGNTVATIKVYPDGQVVYLAGSLLGHVSLHGLSFPLD